MPRGGRRSGAGAPKGNTNALRHGLYSRRVAYSALVLAAVPEFRALFLAMQASERSPRRATVHRALTDAARIVLNDPELAGSIRQIVNQRLRNVLIQIRQSDPE
jgi:hypothetical protein